MTETALKNREIKTREKIADRDRELKEREFKHKRVMDAIGAGAQIAGKVASLFVPGGKAAAAAGGAKALVAAAKANDPSWYKAYIKQLEKWTNLTSWIKLGYEKYEGKLYGIDRRNPTTLKRISQSVVSVPGIAVINWVPTIGAVSSSLTDISDAPINEILQRTKEQVLKSNSRSSVPYEGADLGLNFLGVGSILVALCELERAILIAQTYKADNLFYAERYLTALGWDADTITDDLPKARKILIQLKKRFNEAIVAPQGLNYYKKLMYLATLWAKDSDVNPAQVYASKATLFFRLNDEGDTLEAIYPVRSSLTEYKKQVSLMIQRLTENKDFRVMFEDLRSAFSKNLLQIETGFDENAVITENYDSMAIEQIANVMTLPVGVSQDETWACNPVVASMAIHQSDNGYLYQGTAINNQGATFRMNAEGVTNRNDLDYMLELYKEHPQLVNFHKDEITGDDVLDATRWHFTLSKLTSDDDWYYFTVDNSDIAICTHISISCINGTGAYEVYNVGTHMCLGSISVDTVYALYNITKASSFDWMPLIHVHWTDVVGTTSINFHTETIGEVQHTVEYPVGSLQDINDVCVLSLMYIDSSEFRIPGR